MQIIVNIDGTIMDAGQARISPLDHGFLFGDSVYETLRTYDRRPFLFSRHMDRLDRAAARVHLQLPWSRERFRDELQRTIEAAEGPAELRIRMVLTRGVGDLNADPASCGSPGVLLFVAPLAELPPEIYTEGVSVTISSLYRDPQLAEVKTGNLIRQVLAVREARAAAVFESILLTPDGWISDGITSNVYLLRGTKLMTPSPKANIVEGITRAVVLDLASRLDLDVEEGLYTRAEMFHADEMFLTSTTREVVPIVRVDRQAIGDGRPGAVTRRLLQAYRREVPILIEED